MDYNIVYEENTELAEFEAFNKGYRGDIIVIIGEKRYKIYISSMIRLQQDFETEQRDSGYYMAEPNTFLVDEVTKENIIAKMYKCGYFERLDKYGF